MKPNESKATPSLDEIAANPSLVVSLQPQDWSRVLLQIATIQGAIAAVLLADTSPSTPVATVRRLSAIEAAERLGKTVGWMKTQGRSLPGARRIGRSWGWLESELVDYLRRRR